MFLGITLLFFQTYFLNYSCNFEPWLTKILFTIGNIILLSKTLLDVRTQDRKKEQLSGYPGGTMVKNPPADAEDTGLSPGPGRYHMPWSN